MCREWNNRTTIGSEQGKTALTACLLLDFYFLSKCDESSLSGVILMHSHAANKEDRDSSIVIPKRAHFHSAANAMEKKSLSILQFLVHSGVRKVIEGIIKW